jgi:hypothetical protein
MEQRRIKERETVPSVKERMEDSMIIMHVG